MDKFWDWIADMALKIECEDCVVMKYLKENPEYIPRCDIYQENCTKAIKDVYNKIIFGEELTKSLHRMWGRDENCQHGNH